MGSLERAWTWARRDPAQAAAPLGGALLGLGLAGAALWLGLPRAHTEHVARAHLSEVAQAERASDWAAARTALERAMARLGDGASAGLRAEVARAQAELELVARFEASGCGRSTRSEPASASCARSTARARP